MSLSSAFQCIHFEGFWLVGEVLMALSNERSSADSLSGKGAYPIVSDSTWHRLVLLVRILVNFELAGSGDDQEAVKGRAMLRLQQAGTIVK